MLKSASFLSDKSPVLILSLLLLLGFTNRCLGDHPELANIWAHLREGSHGSLVLFLGMLLSDHFRWLKPLQRSPSSNAATDITATDIASDFRGADLRNAEQMRAALRQSEERFRIAVNSLPDIFVIYDAERRIQFINAVGLRRTNKPIEALLGRREEEIWSPEITSGYLPTLIRTVETRQIQSVECSFNLSPTTTYTLIMKYVPLLDEQGNLQQILGFTFDITDRKQAETEVQLLNQALEQRILERTAQLQLAQAELEHLNDGLEHRVIQRTLELELTNRRLEQEIRDRKRSEARYRRIIESNIFGVAFGDINGNIIDANDYFLNMTGYERSELEAGQIRWIEMTPPEYLYLDWAAGAELRQRGVTTPFEKEYIRKDGSRVPILIGSAFLNEPYQEQVEVVSFYVDLTSLKQTEAALSESEERFRLLAENSSDLIALMEQDGRFVYACPAYERVLGYSPDRLLTMNLRQIIHPDDLKQLSGWHNQESIEFRVQDAQGDWIWIEGITYPIDSAEQPLIVGIGRDITERKRAEAEREYLLKQEQTARQQAEAVNRIKDEFLAVLSHELRSPLNPILGWTKLLRMRQFDEKMTERALDTIERNAKLQTQLIEDLLDISRILRGKMSLHNHPVNLTAVIEAAIETVSLAAEAKGIIVQLPPGLPPFYVLGDASRLQQVMWNLLSNAIKFTPYGGKVAVQVVEVESVDRQTNLAQITVSDSGKGIASEFLPFVFESFRQADSSTTRTYGGLGLGLAIVRHLVELHGGTVRAESLGEGQGATFIVQLPMLPPDFHLTSSAALPLLFAKAYPLQGIHILIVDDEPDMRDYVSTVLEQAGAEITLVGSAAQAVAAVMRHIPDLIISDIGMPQVDGYMLLQQIRQLPPDQGGQIPAIALTAYASAADARKAIAAGFQRHMAKPTEPQNLIQTIVQLLGRE
ncbi:MAG TPA: PAS domain S-box protein [Trichocoleus sp.]|jgi:PAS domain S-box-containing protein